MTLTEKIARQLEKTPIQIALLLLLCGILYGQVFWFGYVFDDLYQFESQYDLRSGPLSWHTLSKSIITNAPYFRPLPMLTWFIEFHSFGVRPWASHGINILFFCCNILLVRSLALDILKRSGFSGNLSMRAWLAAVIYTVHPALVESTVWVSGRFDLLCTLFILLAIKFFLATESRAWIQFIGVLICSLLALFSKELGVVLTGTLFCVAMAVQSGHGVEPRSKFLHSAMAALAHYRWGFYGVIFSLAVYFAVRTSSMEVVYGSRITLSYFYSSFITQQLPIEAMRLYTGLTLFPSVTGISFFRDYADRSIWTFISSLGTVMMMAAVVWMAVKRRKWAWLILAGFSGLVLVIHIVPLDIGDNIVHERFLAMPLAFFAMAAVSIKWTNFLNIKFFEIKDQNKKFMFRLVFLGWLAVCVSTTLAVLPTWKNNTLWWGINYKLAPREAKAVARPSYINALFLSKRYDQIISLLDPELKEGKQVSLMEFFYYSRSLLAKGDPRADSFLNQLISAADYAQIAPANNPSSSPQESAFSMQIGIMYTDYAAMKINDGDIDSSVRYANAGIKYLPKSFALRPVLLVTIGNYLKGDFDAGWSTIKPYVNLNDIGDLGSGAKKIAINYCNGLVDGKFNGTEVNKSACERLRKSDFFRVRDFFGPIS